MQTGVQFCAGFIEVDIVIPDVLVPQGIDRVIQHAQIAHRRVRADIRCFKVKARQTKIQRQLQSIAPTAAVDFGLPIRPCWLNGYHS